MRRQTTTSGINPAGSSRALRLDPLALPIRFSTSDASADEQVRWIELDHERVVLRRAVRGVPMAIKLPVHTFLGVALDVRAAERGGSIAVSLAHRDPALSIPLFAELDGSNVLAEWQLWARVLRLPLLVTDGRGELREPFERMGGVQLGSVCPRRRRRNAIKFRRPAVLLRRRAPSRLSGLPIYRGEREIIARD